MDMIGLCVDFVKSRMIDFPTSIFFKVMQVGLDKNDAKKGKFYPFLR